MKSFKDFNIKVTTIAFIGDKIQMDRIINREITVTDFRIEDSIKKQGTKFLTMQIKVNDVSHVIFTGSRYLMDQINQVPKSEFPFTTTIVKDNGRYEFS